LKYVLRYVRADNIGRVATCMFEHACRRLRSTVYNLQCFVYAVL
jgi:hypothetical protein